VYFLGATISLAFYVISFVVLPAAFATTYSSLAA